MINCKEDEYIEKMEALKDRIDRLPDDKKEEACNHFNFIIQYEGKLNFRIIHAIKLFKLLDENGE